MDPKEIEAEANRFREDYAKVRAEIGKAIVGQHEVVEGVLTGIFTGGNCLLEGVPGLGKTHLIRTLSLVLDLDFQRIQFTPDLMPADIIGTNIVVEHEGGGREFQFRQGPIFAQLVLADEVNRATPKTQSAMLEAMQARKDATAAPSEAKASGCPIHAPLARRLRPLRHAAEAARAGAARRVRAAAAAAEVSGRFGIFKLMIAAHLPHPGVASAFGKPPPPSKAAPQSHADPPWGAAAGGSSGSHSIAPPPKKAGSGGGGAPNGLSTTRSAPPPPSPTRSAARRRRRRCRAAAAAASARRPPPAPPRRQTRSARRPSSEAAGRRRRRRGGGAPVDCPSSARSRPRPRSPRTAGEAGRTAKAVADVACFVGY